MTRLGAVFWIVLVLASGFTTFQVKYAVQRIDDELNQVRRQAIAEQQQIRVLTAEWSFLNQPERLAQLNREFLKMAPISTKQLQQRIEDLPWRAPVAGPDILVAAHPPLSAPASLPVSGRPVASLPVASLSAARSAAMPALGRPSAGTPPAAVSAVAAALPPVRPAAASPARPGHLVTAVPPSLDALFAQIAGAP
jgi:hypothetical protein